MWTAHRAAIRRFVSLAILILPIGLLARAADKPGTDVITFTNGDRLTGTLISETDGTVSFHSDVSGDIKVSWDQVTSLRAAGSFAVIPPKIVLKSGRPAPQIPIGPVAVENGTISVSGVGGEVKNIPTKDAAYLVDAADFQKAIARGPGLLEGWTGPITLGATLIQSTQTSQTFTGAVALVRAMPTVDWVQPKDKTLFDATATYGMIRQPFIPGVQTASSAKTSILHGDIERDQYISPRFYYLFDASADHNVGSGLQVQQDYGVGVGATLIKNSTRTFDVKGDIHYERQEFYPGVNSSGGENVNLIGATIAEDYMQKLTKGGMVFSESAEIQPAFNTPANSPSAYTAQALASLIFPVYKNLGFSLATQDNFINNPPLGFKKNTFQFTAGLTYTLK